MKIRGRQLIATALLTMSSSVSLHAGDDVVLHFAGSQSPVTMTAGSSLTFTSGGIKIGNQDNVVGFGSITLGLKRDAIRTATDTGNTPSGEPVTVQVVMPTVQISYPDPEFIAEVAKDISKATITVNGSYTYNGQAIQPEFIVQYDGAVLTRGTDYTVTFSQNVNAGTATITVTGMDKYTGTVVKTFTIQPATLTVTADDTTKVYLAQLPDLTYKITGFVGSETENVLTKKPEVATEANWMSPVGKYAITVSGAEARNYVFTYASGTLTVTPKDLSAATLTLQDDSCAYTGNAITPVPTVTLDDIDLTPAVDYELTYSNNIEPGVATMTVTGIDNYTGQIDTTFVIYLEQSTEVRINGELVQGVPDADNPKQLTFKHDWGTVVVSNAFAPAFGTSDLTVTATDTTLISSIYRNETTKVFLATADGEPEKQYMGNYIVPLSGKVMIDVTFAIDSIAVGIQDFVAGELAYSVYDLRGHKIDGGVAADKQEVMDRIRRQPQGLYIIKVNNKTIKVYNK